jgi:hypothetical protein
MRSDSNVTNDNKLTRTDDSFGKIAGDKSVKAAYTAGRQNSINCSLTATNNL